MKKLIQLFFAFALIFTMAIPQTIFADENDLTLNYVALGDSLAAGMIEDGSFGQGYVDNINEYLDENTAYNTSLNNFGVAGYTSTEVLEDISMDEEVQAALAQADFITLTAGANDLLQAVDIGNLDEVDEEEIFELITEVSENIGTILYTINEINPEADVYVMGYYNALPYLEDYQPLIIQLIQGLNQGIATASGHLGAQYVPTFDVFEGNYEDYLPNPDNIHPSELGYQKIAEAFLPFILENLDEANDDDEESEDPGDDESENGDDEEEGSDEPEDDSDSDEEEKGENPTDEESEDGSDSDTDDGSDTPEMDESNGDESEQETGSKESDENEEAVAGEDENAGDGQRLPDTATDMYTMILIGGLFILLGAVVFFVSRRKAVE